MEKKKIELFIEQHGLILEIDARHDKVTTMLYKEDDTDLYIIGFTAPTMNESINMAVKGFLKKHGLK